MKVRYCKEEKSFVLSDIPPVDKVYLLIDLMEYFGVNALFPPRVNRLVANAIEAKSLEDIRGGRR